MQRSGSTVLFDQLRYSPCFLVEPSWKFFRMLGISAGRRRYPRDVSQSSGRPDHRIEVLPDDWVYMEQLLPAVQVEEKTKPGIYVEKIHPHFVRHSMRNLQAAAALVDVNVVIVTRKPSDAISSFWRYQARTKDWYPNVGRLRTLLHFFRELTFLAKVKESNSLRCIHVSYEEFTKYPERVAERIKQWIGCIPAVDQHNVLSVIRKPNQFQTGNNESTGLGHGPVVARILGWIDFWYDRSFR